MGLFCDTVFWCLLWYTIVHGHGHCLTMKFDEVFFTIVYKCWKKPCIASYDQFLQSALSKVRYGNKAIFMSRLRVECKVLFKRDVLTSIHLTPPDLTCRTFISTANEVDIKTEVDCGLISGVTWHRTKHFHNAKNVFIVTKYDTF